MNWHRTLLSLAALFLPVRSGLRAEEPVWRVTVDSQIISAPSALSLRLLPRLTRPELAEAALADLQKAVADGSAEVLAQQRAFLHDAGADTFSSETYRDHRWAVEYSQPMVAGVFGGGGPTFPSIFGYAEAMPTMWETTRVGEALGVTGIAGGDGQTVDLTVWFKKTIFLGTRPFAGGKTAGGVIANVDQPKFRVHTFQGDLTLPTGRWQFVSAFPEKDSCYFLLLRATAKRLLPLRRSRTQKAMKLITNLATLAALLCLPLAAPADEPLQQADLEKLGGFIPAPLTYNLHIDVLMVAVPEAEALALLPQLRDPLKIEKACETIHEMLAAQKARLVGWPSVITKPGNRAVTENIDEVRYPIEFAGPAVQLPPDATFKPPPKPLPVPAPPKPGAAPAGNDPVKPGEPVLVPPPKPEGPKKPADKDSPISINLTAFDPIPTTFETRNTGVTLEVEPSLDPTNTLIDLNIAPQHIFFAGMDRHGVEKKDHKVFVEQPRFRMNRVQTNLTLKSGKAVLLEQFKSGEHAGFIEFFILRATARPVK